MKDLRDSRQTSGLSILIILASAAGHIWLILASRLFNAAAPFGDISLYNYWVYQVLNGAPVYGVGNDWVYPTLAFFPMWLAEFLFPFDYEVSWLLIVFVLNTLVALLLQRNESRQYPITPWIYLAGIILLGPVAIARIDAVSVSLATIGVILVFRNANSYAATFFTLAGWIKVWPIAMFIALIAAFKNRIRAIVPAFSMSALIVATSLLVAGNPSVLSFVSSQQERGLQIEAVLATPFLYLAKFDLASIYFDDTWITNQVSGSGSEIVASLSNIALFVALAITFLLGYLAIRRGAESGSVFALTGFTAVLDLIVFNKVGSPQFMLWLIVPAVAIVLFNVVNGKFALLLTAFVLLSTQLVYPIFYLELLNLEDWAIALLAARNLMLVVLLVWANSRLASQKALK